MLFRSTEARLGVDVSGCDYRQISDDAAACAASVDYDVFVNTTYLSTARNQSPIGLYYVHFPERPPTTRQRITRVIAPIAAAVSKPLANGRLGRLHTSFERRAVRTDWAATYTRFLSNSTFTAGWVARLWKVPSEVLYPPVRPEVRPGAKAPVIASIGRFFDPEYGHCKKQLDLVRAFIAIENGAAQGWELALVGGADAASREYALSVRRESLNHAIRVHLNAPRSLVRDTLASAAIFWHAGGFGEDPKQHPERFEHFGIAVVEAMSAGAVPVVYGEAGPAEIVRHGVDGFHWHTIDELTEFTAQLIADPATRAAMSAQAQERADHFSNAAFAQRLLAVLAASTPAWGVSAGERLGE